MERFIQLNLHNENEQAEPANLPSDQQQKVQEPPIIGKRVNRMLNKAAHKAASHYGKGGSGIFSK